MHHSGLVQQSSKTAGGLHARLPVWQPGPCARGRSGPRSFVTKKLSSQRLRVAGANQQPHHNGTQSGSPHPPSSKDDMRVLQEQMLAMQKILLEQQSRSAAMQQQMELLVSRLAAQENPSSSSSNSSSTDSSSQDFIARASLEPSPPQDPKPQSKSTHEPPSPPSPAPPPPPEPAAAQTTTSISTHTPEAQVAPAAEAKPPDSHSIHMPPEPVVHAQVHTQGPIQPHAPATQPCALATQPTAPSEPPAVSSEAPSMPGEPQPSPAGSNNSAMAAAAEREVAAPSVVHAQQSSAPVQQDLQNAHAPQHAASIPEHYNLPSAQEPQHAAPIPEQQNPPNTQVPQHTAPIPAPPGSAHKQGLADTLAATAAAPAEAPAPKPEPAAAAAATASPGSTHMQGQADALAATGAAPAEAPAPKPEPAAAAAPGSAHMQGQADTLAATAAAPAEAPAPKPAPPATAAATASPGSTHMQGQADTLAASAAAPAEAPAPKPEPAVAPGSAHEQGQVDTLDASGAAPVEASSPKPAPAAATAATALTAATPESTAAQQMPSPSAHSSPGPGQESNSGGEDNKVNSRSSSISSSSSSGSGSDGKNRAGGSRKDDDAVLELARKLDQMNTMNAELVELLRSKGMEAPASLLQSTAPLVEQLERLRTSVDDSGAPGVGERRGSTNRVREGRGRSKSNRRSSMGADAGGAASTSPWSTSIWQNIESGLKPDLPPPVDNPFAALPRVPPSKGAQAAAEATAAAAERAKARGPSRPSRPSAAVQNDKSAAAAAQAELESLSHEVFPQNVSQPRQQREGGLRVPGGSQTRPGVRAGAERVSGRERGGRGVSGPRVPMSEVEHMLAAAGNGRGGPPSSLMTRIWNTSSWKELQRMATMQQRALDTQHTVVLLARLATLAPSASTPASAAAAAPPGRQDVKQNGAMFQAETWFKVADTEDTAAVQAFAAELATLLQLQLPRLSPPALAAVVYAVSQLGAAPKPAWVEAARLAAERAARRMDGPQLVATAHGMAALQATPSPAWLSLFWSTTQTRMAEGQLSKLSQLSMAATAAARFQQQGLVLLSTQEAHAQQGAAGGGQRGGVARGAGEGVPREWMKMFAAAAAHSCASCGVEAPAAVVEEYKGWWEQQQQQQQPGVVGEARADAGTGTSAQAAQPAEMVLSGGGPGSAAAVAATAAAPADAAEQQGTPETSDPASSVSSSMDVAPPAAAAASLSPSDTASAVGGNAQGGTRSLTFELGFEPLSAQDAVGFVRACHELGLSAELDQAWVVRLLTRAAGADAEGEVGHAGPTSTTATPQGLQQCGAQDLVGLGSALSALPSTPPPVLAHAYASALWPKLNRVPPAAALAVFQTLASWGYQVPAPMLHSFLAQVAPKEASSGSSGSLRAVSTSALCSFVVALAAYARSSSSSSETQAAAGAGSVSLDYTRLEVLQDELAARGMQDLTPHDMVSLIAALADIQQARALSVLGGSSSMRASSAANVGASSAALPAFRGSLLAAVFRSLKHQLEEVQPSAMALLCTTVARAGAQMDLDLLEAYLAHLIDPDSQPQSSAAQSPSPSSTGPVEPASAAAPAAPSAGAAASSPSQLCALVVGLGEAAVYARPHGNAWKPHSSLLGPFMAHFVQVLPGCQADELVSVAGAFASMQLSREDLQGVRATTASGIPSPSDLTSSLLSALLPHIPLLSMPQLAFLSTSVASLGVASSREWASSFVERCACGVYDASVADLVTLLAALPNLTSSLEGTTQAQDLHALMSACVGRIGEGVAELELPALVDLLGAVNGGQAGGGNGSSGVLGGEGFAQSAGSRGMAAALAHSSSSGAAGGAGGGGTPRAFVHAVLAASEAKMGAADLPTVTRLAAAVAQARAVPSPSWLRFLQAVTAPQLLRACEADAAQLCWAVGKLTTAAARSHFGHDIGQSHSSSNSSGSGSKGDGAVGEVHQQQLLLPEWHNAFGQRVGAQRAGVGEAYSLGDLLRLLWACAALGVRPRAGLLNSFAGKSIDRMSSEPPRLVLESAWATAALGAQMTPKWLNQWTLAVQGPTMSALTPEDVTSLLWALDFHFLGHIQPTLSPAPPAPAPSSSQSPTDSPNRETGSTSGGDPASSAHGPLLVASAASPPATLLEALSTQLCSFLLHSHKDSADSNGLGRSHHLGPFAPSQLVAMSATLACFGHVPSADTSRALAEALQAAMMNQQQQGEQSATAVLTAGEVVASLWSQARFKSRPPPGFVPSALASLQARSLHALSQLQVVRLLWALASLRATPFVTPSLLDHLESKLPVLNPERDQQSSDRTERLSPGDIVDALWALSELGRPVPMLMWGHCMGRLANRVSNLSPPQLSCLLAAATKSENSLSPALANEVSKVAASKFSSAAPIELSDLVYSFARLGLPLAPTFASTAIKRLQTSLALLPTRQLAQTLWAFAAIGYTPLAPQLQAYQQRALTAAPGMNVSEAALILDAFASFNYRPSEQLLDAIERRTLPLMQRSAATTTTTSSSSNSNSGSSITTAPATSADQINNHTTSSISSTPPQVSDPPTAPAVSASSGSEMQATDQNGEARSLEQESTDLSAGEIAETGSNRAAAVAVLDEVAQQPEGGATAGEMVLVLLGLCRSGRLPSQEWLRAWFTMLRAESIATLNADQVLAVLDLLAGTNFGMTPKQRWCAALLQRLQPLLPNLDSKPLQSLLALLAQWEEKGMASAPVTDSRASPTPSVSPSASSSPTQPSYAQLRDQVVHQIPSRVAAKLAAYDAPTVVEMMYDMWVLRAPMSKHLVQRMTQQVQLGLEVGLPTSIMVKLCTALSEHAVFVCTTGDGALPALAMGDAFGQEEEEEVEGLRNLQGGGSPLQGLSLQDSWLLHDEVLSRLDLDSCEGEELVMVLISIQGMVTCLRQSYTVQSQLVPEDLNRLPPAVVSIITNSNMVDPNSLSKQEFKLVQQTLERYWQKVDRQGLRTDVLAVKANGQPYETSMYIEALKQELQTEIPQDQAEPIENDGLVVRRLWVKKMMFTFKSRLREGRMSCQALAQALPAMLWMQLPCMRDQVFIDECMSYASSRMEQEPPAALARLAWALSFCRVIPETQWVDGLLGFLTAPAEQQPDVSRLGPDAVLDLAQALKAWGIQTVRPVLTLPRWEALLSACDEGRRQRMFSPTDAAQLLGSLCALSAGQGGGLPLLSQQQQPLTDAWITDFAEEALQLQQSTWAAEPRFWTDARQLMNEGLSDDQVSELDVLTIEPHAVVALLSGLVARGRGTPAGLQDRSTQLLGMIALQQDVTSLEDLTQVFVAIYRLKLRPPVPWLDLMQQVLTAQRQLDDGDPALKPAISWLDALRRLK